jgi:hypothetical protein
MLLRNLKTYHVVAIIQGWKNKVFGSYLFIDIKFLSMILFSKIGRDSFEKTLSNFFSHYGWNDRFEFVGYGVDPG